MSGYLLDSNVCNLREFCRVVGLSLEDWETPLNS